ncbi:MAG: hypothetical protein JOY90_03320 [Bradyrhizobium sp.]|uniref:cupin domain-containing protein n=1 Tax=Bradyrhizobium sp. TaxID=376 RepID=UPI001DC7274B|nr:hypothetical protein [Bradyrhizobium sp.]MBV9559482.1 hypothetical protein [Bradyrhizobium sp.]
MASKKPKMQIYRAKECRHMTEEEGTVSSMPESAAVGLARMAEAGMADGYVIKVLFDAPGFALHYAWFKPNYPLGRHSHSVDALYYIVSGSMKLGTEWLGAGDGFWLAGDTPYIYTAGPEGLEILEFRHTSKFTSAAQGGTKAFWDKAVGTIEANRDAWLAATPPRAAA